MKENILFEKQIVEYLGLPSIPVKEHDGKMPFDKGVAVVETYENNMEYAICKYDPSGGDKEPRVIKTFSITPFKKIIRIFVVPNYMSRIEDVNSMDLDEDSKKRAEEILKEAKEIEDEGVVENNELTTPKNEYYFEHIKSDEEAHAYIQAYNSRNKIRGKIPTTHEGLVMRLAVIYSDTQKKQK